MAQHKSERPIAAAAVANRGGRKYRDASSAGKSLVARIPSVKIGAKGGRSTSVETIATHLDRKANIAEGQTFTTKILGQMSREQRHKLLYGN